MLHLLAELIYWPCYLGYWILAVLTTPFFFFALILYSLEVLMALVSREQHPFNKPMLDGLKEFWPYIVTMLCLYAIGDICVREAGLHRSVFDSRRPYQSQKAKATLTGHASSPTTEIGAGGHLTDAQRAQALQNLSAATAELQRRRAASSANVDAAVQAMLKAAQDIQRLQAEKARRQGGRPDYSKMSNDELKRALAIKLLQSIDKQEGKTVLHYNPITGQFH